MILLLETEIVIDQIILLNGEKVRPVYKHIFSHFGRRIKYRCEQWRIQDFCRLEALI